MADIHYIGFTDGGDSPEWAAAKASARDVIDTAFRQACPLSGDMERARIKPAILDAIERAIADALFKAWQGSPSPDHGGRDGR